MNRAVTTCFIFIAFCVDFMTGLTTCEAQRWESENLEAFCRTMDKDIWKDLGECEKDFNEYVGKEFLRCKDEADPAVDGGEIKSHVEAICGSGSVMAKYRACLNGVFADEQFLKEVTESRKARDCIADTLKKYDLYSERMVLKEDK